MTRFTIEFWQIVLNVIGVSLWGITILYIIKNRLQNSRRLAKGRGNESARNFGEEILIQTVKQQSERAFEAISETMNKERNALQTLIEERNIDKRKNPVFAKTANKRRVNFEDSKADWASGANPAIDRYGQVLRLANMGLSAREVAEEVKIPKGEVDLIIKLRKGGQGYHGKSQPVRA